MLVFESVVKILIKQKKLSATPGYDLYFTTILKVGALPNAQEDDVKYAVHKVKFILMVTIVLKVNALACIAFSSKQAGTNFDIVPVTVLVFRKHKRSAL